MTVDPGLMAGLGSLVAAVVAIYLAVSSRRGAQGLADTAAKGAVETATIAANVQTEALALTDARDERDKFMVDLRTELTESRAEVKALKEEVISLRETMAHLQNELTSLREVQKENTALQGQVQILLTRLIESRVSPDGAVSRQVALAEVEAEVPIPPKLPEA